MTTLDPLSNSKSSQGSTSECGSSRQVSSIGQPASSLGTSSRQATVKVMASATTSDGNTKSAGLQRRSTRDLIDIFENKTVSNSFATSPASHPLRRGTFNAPLPDLPKSTQLKQSFRNLIAVFSKGKKTLNEPAINTHVERNSQQYEISNGGVSSHSRYSQSAVDQNLVTLPSTSKPTISRMAPKLPPELRNGILLYYEENATNPVWHRCDAFLAPPNLHLSYFAPNGLRSTRCISVTTAIDARSIATARCATIIPPLLDGNTPYVFEIEFDTENKEVFATSSLAERGGWISTIWDAIISSKYGSSSTHLTTLQNEPKTEQFLPPSPIHETIPEDFVSSQPRSLKMSSEARHRAERSTVSMTSNTSSSSKRNDSATSASSRSPSIRTLGSLSIVHKRLARIDTLQRARLPMNHSAYATPPRTPPPEDRIPSRERTSLSRGHTLKNGSHLPVVIDDNRELSDMEIEQEPPFIALDASNQSPEFVEDGVKEDNIEDQILNAIPRRVPNTKHLRDSTTGQGAFIEVLSREVTATAFPFDILNRFLTDLATSLQEIKVERHEQQQTVAMLERKIRSMHKEMKITFQQPPLPIPQLDDLSSQIKTLAERLDSSEAEALRLKLERFEELMQTLVDARKDDIKSNTEREEASIAGANESGNPAVWEEMKAQVPFILEKIKEIQLQLQSDKSLPSVPTGGDEVSKAMAETKQKLESIEALITTFKSEWKENTVPTESFDPPPGKALSVFKQEDGKEPDTSPTECVCESKVTEILHLLAEAQEKPSVTSDQFEDSVRYLQELNTWMEKFALHNEGQGSLLSDIKAAIEGLSQQSKENPSEAESEALNLPAMDHGDFESALEDVRSDLVSRLDEINHQLQQDVPPKDGQDLGSVMELMESNHREQKELLRSIFDDLSSDIKGERIRFVDAMKEATSVNVNTHLEEFKRQLNQEMMVMLQEVGRTARARERKHLEQEIAHIFNQQVVERQKSMGFQPLQPMRPLRPVPQGHHPGVMIHPHMHASATPAPIPHPTMPMYPPTMGPGSRPLPTPSPRPRSTIQPQEVASQQEELLRRKA
ncbi:hypothetical protein CPB86DRAFT_786797 [Serendipita vermifera]|nr:hypothetical protein CPB86DRAFT_786797 [Serendipita vermifera]